ncbi:glutathione S-transferase [Boletus reticuloceps]|uniref:Glutathione S-transferase n=1 Tax=Boletus reticuloceps TaxID=495285 RepID=A0A8I2YZ34_9AGAM|nr:glutathione S-transferase [Boletus reticuloceps]
MTDTGKSYHKQCTGEALQTVQRHAADEDITLFAGCFCPFVQRGWAALEYLGIPYKYYEVDPYKKPRELLEVSPKGLVPALRLSNYNPPRALNESTVIMDFLEDLASTSTKRTLLPPITDPYARALVRLQSDHINRTLVPAFYRYLQAQDPTTQITGEKEFKAGHRDARWAVRTCRQRSRWDWVVERGRRARMGGHHGWTLCVIIIHVDSFT